MGKSITNDQLDKLSKQADVLNEVYGDPDKTNRVLNDMLETLGEKPMFTTTEEFLAFMESNEPLVL